MKIRNKKTGEVKEFNEIFLTKTVNETNTTTSEYIERSYCKIAELNEEWEDYEPKEPLIKDEKIRKAVRAWAEANYIKKDDKLHCCQGHGCSFIKVPASDAQFSLMGTDYGIPYDDYCTIAELCGEEGNNPL